MSHHLSAGLKVRPPPELNVPVKVSFTLKLKMHSFTKQSEQERAGLFYDLLDRVLGVNGPELGVLFHHHLIQKRPSNKTAT